MVHHRTRRQSLAQVPYSPPAGYALDVEVMTIADLRRRANSEQLRTPHRLAFMALIGVTRGRCLHTVDFIRHDCNAGAWLIVRPGQVISYDPSARWNGWQCVFRPEFLLPQRQEMAPVEAKVYASLESLPARVSMRPAEHRAAMACLRQMARDASGASRGDFRHPLLRHQLYSVVLRLLASHQRMQPANVVAPGHMERFKRYRNAVEREFARTHCVADLAQRIGCTGKSLTRAVTAAAGMSPKAYLSQRVALEGKRLLAHTGLPVASIGERIGFAEPTNFIKFFRRETGLVPGEFRRQRNAEIDA